MSESSAAILEFATADVASLAELGNITSSPVEEQAVRLPTQRPTVVIRILTRQAFSDQASLDSFIAKQFSVVPGVKLVSRERTSEKFRFYVVIDDSNPKTLEQVFDVEGKISARFAGDELDFEVLPGEELECVIPTKAIPLWRFA